MSDDLNRQFIAAAKCGDLGLLERLWLEGADIDANFGEGGALGQAAGEGHLSCVNFLIEKGSDLELRNGKGSTPLMHAGCYGYLEIARALLAAGADPAARSTDGNNHSAEYWARFKCHAAVADLLEGAVKRNVPPPVQPPRVKIEGNNVICVKKLVDRNLQEVFNFEARERISLLRHPATNVVEAMTRESFSSIDDQDAIQKAFDFYKSAGGKISEDVVFPDRIVKGVFALKPGGKK